MLSGCTRLWKLALVVSVHANIDDVVRCEAPTARECARIIGQSSAGAATRAQALKAVSALQPFLATSEGQHVLSQFLEVNRRLLPDVVDQVEGLAEGVGVTSRQMMISAMFWELSFFAKRAGFAVAPAHKSCSDFHALGGGDDRLRRWIHNEDSYPSDVNNSYVVDFNASGARHIGFVYDAQAVAGWAWSINSHGLAHSVNALFPTNMSIGLATSLLARDVGSATSLDDAARRACRPEVASGQHFNLGSLAEPDRQLMIESSYQGCDVRTLRPPTAGGGLGSGGASAAVTNAWHANLYESSKLRGIDGGPSSDPSTVHRMARMQTLAPVDSAAGLEAVVSDTTDTTYPIHRPFPVRPPDMFGTLNTVLFDAVGATVSLWQTESPAASGGRAVASIDWRAMRWLAEP
jgi:hypothetical protein